MRAQDHFTARHYDSKHHYGPISSLNPTARFFPVQKPTTTDDGRTKTADVPSVPDASRTGSEAKHQVHAVWRSRDNRKGRHALAITPDYLDHADASLPQPTDTLSVALRGIGKMFRQFPLWDISYDVAIIFTLGSVVWCFNGFFVWLPLAAPWTEFEGESSMGGGVTAFIGATVFEIGSVFLMLEAVNENRADCFGWALEEALAGNGVAIRQEQKCRHHHQERKAFLKAGTLSEANGGAKGDRSQRKWSWWPSWYELRTHYFREIGFLACLSQMIGATIFWIAGLTGLPPIYDALSPSVLNGAYWVPQVIGGSGFIISSWLFMLETQKKWYIPSFKVLGWHIGFWNLVGAIGFTLCGALGFGIDDPAVEYAATLSTFIGSWAFLIGSVIQWYESLSKYPISVEKSIL